VAIKIGDTNLSATNSGLWQNAETRTRQKIQLLVKDEHIAANETVVVPFFAQNFDQITGYQLGIHFDEAALDFMGILSPLATGFDFHQTKQKRLST